jgi:murein DD-endopeptidase MepM/ murein hydrolase activator NlpD
MSDPPASVPAVGAVLASALTLAALVSFAAPGREGSMATGAVPQEAVPPGAGPAYGTYAWPVEGPVIRGFDPPETPYGSGHRGIDIAAPLGTTVRAAHDGVVAFAGRIGGAWYVSIDHPDGVRTTYSWMGEVRAGRGDAVGREDAIGATGSGHPGGERPHLHFGARIGDRYIDPMLLLERGTLVGLVRLAPLD